MPRSASIAEGTERSINSLALSILSDQEECFQTAPRPRRIPSARRSDLSVRFKACRGPNPEVAEHSLESLLWYIWGLFARFCLRNNPSFQKGGRNSTSARAILSKLFMSREVRVWNWPKGIIPTRLMLHCPRPRRSSGTEKQGQRGVKVDSQPL